MLTILGCTSEAPPRPAIVAAGRVVPVEEAATDGRYVIGAVLATQGVLAADEAPVIEALRRAVERANAAGGIAGQPIELRVRDSKSSVTTAARVATELADQGVDAFAVGCDVDVASTVGRTARRTGRLAFSTCAADDAFGVDTASAAAFDFAPATSALAGALVERVVANGGGPVVTIADLMPYESTAACQRFSTAYRAGGGAVIADVELAGADSPAIVAARVGRLATPRVVVSCLGRGRIGSVLAALRDVGITAPIVALGGADAPPWPDGVVDGVELVTIADLSRPVDALAPYVAAGARSGPAVLTFVALDVLARAAALAPDTRAESLAAVLRRERFATPIGELRFDARQRATGHTLVVVRTAGDGVVPLG